MALAASLAREPGQQHVAGQRQGDAPVRADHQFGLQIRPPSKIHRNLVAFAQPVLFVGRQVQSCAASPEDWASVAVRAATGSAPAAAILRLACAAGGLRQPDCAAELPVLVRSIPAATPEQYANSTADPMLHAVASLAAENSQKPARTTLTPFCFSSSVKTQQCKTAITAAA